MDDNSNIRSQNRVPIKANLTGMVFVNNIRLKCVACDISKDGLGMFAYSFIKEGSPITLKVKGHSITLEVKWIKSEGEKKSIFRIGTQLQDSSVNLMEIMERHGLIEIPKEELKEDEKVDINFKVIKPFLSNLHTPDDSFFRTQKRLSRLSDKYEFYPIKIGEHSLGILLRKEISPKKALEFDDKQAANKLIIIAKYRNNWHKIWPKPPKESESNSTSPSNNGILYEAILHTKNTIEQLSAIYKNPTDIKALAAIGEKFYGVFSSFWSIKDRHEYILLYILAEITDSICKIYCGHTRFDRIETGHLNVVSASIKLSYLILLDAKKGVQDFSTYYPKIDEIKSKYIALQDINHREFLNKNTTDHLVKLLIKKQQETPSNPPEA